MRTRRPLNSRPEPCHPRRTRVTTGTGTEMEVDQLLGADVQWLSAESLVRRNFVVQERRLGNRERAERIARGEADGEAELVLALFMSKPRPDDPEFDAEWESLARSEARSV